MFCGLDDEMTHFRRLGLRLLLLGVMAPWPAVALGEPMCAAPPNVNDTLLSMDLASLLDQKVTTASKFAETPADAPGVISVVSRDELRRFGGITVREILERVPGLTPATAYFTDRSLLASRGDQTKINGGHLLVLINGRPTREVLEGGVVSDLLESFPVDALERIEVIKGPGSVLYGSNAFSAVINLITQKADHNGLVMSGFPGSAGALGSSGQAMLACGQLQVIAAGQYHRKPDWHATYRLPESLVNDEFASSQAPVQQATIRDRGTGGYLGVAYKRLSLMSSFTEWNGASFVRGTVGENRWRRGFADLGYTTTAREHWDMSVNLTYSRTTLDVPDFPNIGRDSNEVVLEWTNTLTPTSRDQLTFGTLYNHIAGQETYFGITPAITISEGTRSGGALYAQLDHRLLRNLKMIGGFQANKIGSLDLSVVPRAGIIWNPRPLVTVKGLYSSAFRAPSINETRLNHPGLAGNPLLRPEKVGTLDVGISYQGEQVQGGVNYYHSRQTDSIIVDSSTPRWLYRNLGEATFQGVEFEGKYYLSRNLFALGSYSYQVNEDNNGLSDITPVPNTGAKAGLSYQSRDGLTLSLFDSYQGKLRGYGQTVNPGPASYHLVSANAMYDLSRFLPVDASHGITVFARADNLADRQVWLPDWGGNTGDTIPAMRGRTIYFGIQVR